MWVLRRIADLAVYSAVCLAFALSAGDAQAQVWRCDGVSVNGGSLLACPTASVTFGATGEVSHESDGDSTSVHIDLDDAGTEPFFLHAIGYFWLEVDVSTHLSFDYDVQQLQGSAASLSIFDDCENATFLTRPGGSDLYIGPGGDACYAFVESAVFVGGPGSYESITTVTAASTSLPVSPSLAVEIIDEDGDGNESLSSPYGVGVDSSGSVFVAGGGGTASVFEIAPGGSVTQVYDGPGDDVFGLAVDGNDDVYIVEDQANTATRITPGIGATQIIDATGDGAGNTLDRPVDVAVDASGNAYVAGLFSNNVFRITPVGVITEIIDASGDGVHPLAGPNGVAVDAAGNAYVSSDSSDVFAIAPGGAITRILDASGDGGGNVLGGAFGVAASPAGDVYVAGRTSDNVFHVSPTGTVTQVLDATGNGSGHVCDLPIGIALDPAQSVYVTCFGSRNMLRVAPDGTVTELMDVNGDGVGNPLSGPLGIVYAGGRLYVTGVGSHNAFRIPLVTNVPLPRLAGPVLAGLMLASAAAHLRRRAQRPLRRRRAPSFATGA